MKQKDVCVFVCVDTHGERQRQTDRVRHRERERQRDRGRDRIYFKEMAYTIVEVGKSNTCRVGQKAETQGTVGVVA